ncbi:MAG: copper oxidase, partial [Acidovorax sp.]
PLEMGGMFTTFKVRASQPAGDYRDPGDYPAPPGTVAFEWQGAPAATPQPVRTQAPGTTPGAATVRKPTASGHQH